MFTKKGAAQLPELVGQLVALDTERVALNQEEESLRTEKKALEDKEAALVKRVTDLKRREDEIDKALTEAGKKGKVSIPSIVREVVRAMLRVRESFVPEKLTAERPTPTDPIIKYDGKIIMWFLEV
jgi:hypothetical protein